MIEIILIIITGIVALITSFVGAIAIQKSSCQDNTCCDIVMETEPNDD